MKDLSCFKAYDIRGKLGEELNSEIAYAIGKAFAEFLKPVSVVLGGDVRATSEELKSALAKGILDSGCDVIDIGMTGTEEVYFAVQHLKVDGGIEVTASHNPIDYNGMKIVKQGSRPISNDSGLTEIKKLTELYLSERNEENRSSNLKLGSYRKLDTLQNFVDFILSFIDVNKIKPLKIVVNSGNGAAGHVIDCIENVFKNKSIPISFVKIHHQPDASFPNGIPNPIIPQNQLVTSNAVKQHNADFGVAWDGDFDRCFLFDENGRFIEGYYIVGLLAEAFLQKSGCEKVIHDPRLTWNTEEIVKAAGGKSIQSKTGHAFIKERMRKEDAIYGGEMSAHHYFRDFGYCDSGMIPWLLVAELVSNKSTSLSTLVNERIEKFPSPGEINFKVTDVSKVIAQVEHFYSSDSLKIDRTDGISLNFPDWRFNLRGSNTEPVIRLNLETRGDIKLMELKLAELSELISRFS